MIEWARWLMLMEVGNELAGPIVVDGHLNRDGRLRQGNNEGGPSLN